MSGIPMYAEIHCDACGHKTGGVLMSNIPALKCSKCEAPVRSRWTHTVNTLNDRLELIEQAKIGALQKRVEGLELHTKHADQRFDQLLQQLQRPNLREVEEERDFFDSERQKVIVELESALEEKATLTAEVEALRDTLRTTQEDVAKRDAELVNLRTKNNLLAPEHRSAPAEDVVIHLRRMIEAMEIPDNSRKGTAYYAAVNLKMVLLRARGWNVSFGPDEVLPATEIK